MSYHNIFLEEQQEPLPSVFTSRADILKKLQKKPVCDVLVVGGGIHGAAVANLVALNGLSVVLLEQADFAEATSSNSSKLIHGGLRYLEQLDFAQVFDGIKAREDLFDVAPHLVKPHSFLIPIGSKDWFSRVKFKLGLTIYDLFVRLKVRRHKWQEDLSDSALNFYSQTLAGAYGYTDGITEDSRLVIEHIIAARQEGAICLNYVKVVSYNQQPGGVIDVGWFDQVNKENKSLKAGVIVNCAGPWAFEMGRLNPNAKNKPLLFSRGAHIVFNQPFKGPCLFLPRKEKGRYYFVLPHFAGTLVGTTERPVERAELHALPDRTELEELLQLLKTDLPELNLTSANAHYCFAGVRSLPVSNSSNTKTTAKISRRHKWLYNNGVFTLLGGKYTTARSVAFEVLKKIYKLSYVQNKPQSLFGRKLPGASMYDVSVREFRQLASAAGVPEELIARTILLRGSLVRHMEHCENPFQVLGEVVLSGDVEIAIRIEQAQSISDIMRRRCGLEYLPGHGLSALDQIGNMLVKFAGVTNIEEQKKEYRERINKIIELLGSS